MQREKRGERVGFVNVAVGKLLNFVELFTLWGIYTRKKNKKVKVVLKA